MAVNYSGAPSVRIFLLRLDPGAQPVADKIAQAMADLSDRASDQPAAQCDAPAVNCLAINPHRHWNEALAVLGSDEADRAGRLRDRARMQAYVHAHACLRLLLARHLGDTAAPAIAFAAGPAGKPRLDREPASVHFSLSYRSGFVAIALGDAPLGVDVERVEDGIDMAGIAQRFFAPDEQAHLAATSPAARRRAFFALWTRKEALVKAAGVGVDLLAACSALKSPAKLVDEHGDPRRYWVHELKSSSDHALALAVEMPGAPI